MGFDKEICKKLSPQLISNINNVIKLLNEAKKGIKASTAMADNPLTDAHYKLDNTLKGFHQCWD